MLRVCLSSAARSKATCCSPAPCSRCLLSCMPCRKRFTRLETTRPQPSLRSTKKVRGLVERSTSPFRFRLLLPGRELEVARLFHPPFTLPESHSQYNQCTHSAYEPCKVLPSQTSDQVNDFRAELDREQRQDQKPDATSRENSGQKMRKAHFERGSREHEQLEWRGRRQHGGKHHCPEFVLLKGGVNLVEAFFGDPLAQNRLSPQVPDSVNN